MRKHGSLCYHCYHKFRALGSHFENVSFICDAIPSMFFILQSDPWMRMLGMGNTFNFDGEDNYRHVIFLYSDLSCCQHSYRVKRSWLGALAIFCCGMLMLVWIAVVLCWWLFCLGVNSDILLHWKRRFYNSSCWRGWYWRLCHSDVECETELAEVDCQWTGLYDR